SGDVSIIFTVTAPATSPITDADLQILSGVGTFQDVEAFPGTTNGSLTARDLLPHVGPISSTTSLLVTDDLTIGPASGGCPARGGLWTNSLRRRPYPSRRPWPSSRSAFSAWAPPAAGSGNSAH